MYRIQKVGNLPLRRSRQKYGRHKRCLFFFKTFSCFLYHAPEHWVSRNWHVFLMFFPNCCKFNGFLLLCCAAGSTQLICLVTNFLLQALQQRRGCLSKNASMATTLLECLQPSSSPWHDNHLAKQQILPQTIWDDDFCLVRLSAASIIESSASNSYLNGSPSLFLLFLCCYDVSPSLFNGLQCSVEWRHRSRMFPPPFLFLPIKT